MLWLILLYSISNLFNSHYLFEANQLQPVNTGNIFNSSLARRSLNLDEYKKKKGLI